MLVTSAELLSTATTLDAMPQEGVSEIAVIGRSNVGKSSLINRLTQRKKLAFTSSVPGKTQSFHSYEITLRDEDAHLTTFHLVDLPGFGYAKFAKKKREYISRLTVDYILSRDCLKGVMLLNDFRRDPEEDEQAIQNLAFENDISLIIVLTKADKLKRNEIEKRRKIIASQYGLEGGDVLISGEKYPTEPIWKRIASIVGE
ncbi:MAG: ribosome biogenesis GTP-binding protein YsxC [Bdellovibrionales bacterium]|nr:ribosome biogenesis GTP-binding protein YsxC [Bdellovibrionales bacterium]